MVCSSTLSSRKRMTRKTYKYRVYLLKGQRRILDHTLEECRWVYNQTLAARGDAYTEGVPLGLYDTQALLPSWKAERPSLKVVHSQVLQNILVRVYLAFKAFFRRVKEGAEAVGFPRFEQFGPYDSLTYPQYGNGVRLEGEQRIASKIGAVKLVMHRPLEGIPKTVTFSRSGAGISRTSAAASW
jgi:putative transposase